jgi:hypothetical protein
MAGGMTFPNQRFNVPHSKAGSGSLGINGVDRNGNPVTPTPAQLGIPTGAFYTKDVLDSDLAGRMPAQVGASNYASDPVGYVRAAGFIPASQADADALMKYPELAVHVLAQSVAVRGRLAASTGRHAGGSVHASLGGNAPADAKCSCFMAAL